MDKLQKSLIISLLSTSGIGWILARLYQVDMMSAMIPPFDPPAISLFVAVWTAGMAAMMFPAISPVVLLYNRLARNSSSGAAAVAEEIDPGIYSVKMILFVASYLAVWALTGLALIAAWGIPVSSLLATFDQRSVAVAYGTILVVAGAYQFSPLKSKCLGYCESPMSLFMRRWRKGTFGAISMGTYHGLYCLGCCWPYFLLMVALGWMDILWMALFAGIIFGEKVWSKGIWVARAAGVGFIAVGILSVSGLVTMGPSDDSMAVPESMGMNSETPAAEMNGIGPQSQDISSPDGGTPTGGDMRSMQ